MKQRTRLHHQHSYWERNYRDYKTKIEVLWIKRQWLTKSFLKKGLNLT